MTASPFTPQPLQRGPEGMLPWHSPHGMALAALGLGLVVQFLFYGRPAGISFPIWALLCILALLACAWLERVRPAADGWLLVLPLLFFAAMVAVRSEPMSLFLDGALTLALFALWLRVFGRGRLVRFGWLDYGLALVWVPLESWIRPWGVLSAAWRRVAGESSERSKALAIARGLILALPVVIVFTVLLSAADLIFSDYVRQVLHWLGLDRIVELIMRLALALISGLFFLGALAIALQRRPESRPIGEDRPLVSPFLGSMESVVVLAAVDLLFAAFVAVQFAYLFGGQANITITGYTYAEYARRGFGELVAVSILTLGMILGLGAFTRRESRRSGTWFNGLCVLLVMLVGVILASALMRLLLYENAYGFTRLRTYTHFAILWMGALFVAFLALLLTNRLRQFASIVMAGAVGLAATLNLVGVDSFIVQRNGARLVETRDLDTAYLATLSDDAVPALVRLALNAPLPQQRELLADLACRQAQLQDRVRHLDWPSYNWSRDRALRALEEAADRLADFPVKWMRGGWVVEVEGKLQPCYPSWID
ncbi:MAG: DUF4173 domain-containing protein [Chloroflexota bacterium]